MSDKEELAYDHMRVDCLSQLCAWGAPWHKSWMELSMLEKRWSIAKIEEMVDERASHPDYSQNVVVKYPDQGWMKDMLEKTKPGFYEAQTLATVIGSMTSTLGHEFKSMFNDLTEEEIEERKIAILVLRDSLDAFGHYCPDTLDEEGVILFEKSKESLLTTFRVQLASILCEEGSTEEAEMVFPGISNPEDLISPEVVEKQIKDLFENTQATVDYMKRQSVFGTDDQQEYLAEHDGKMASDFEGEQLDGLHSKSDTTIKRLLKEACHSLLGRESGDFEIAKEKTDKALFLLGEFVDPASGEVVEANLQQIAEDYSKIDYDDDYCIYLNELAEKIFIKRYYHEARKLHLLDYQVKSLDDTRDDGYEKGTDDMYHLKSLGLCSMGLKRYEEAYNQLLKSFELAQKYSKPTDITGRTISEFHPKTARFYLWLVCKLSDRDEEQSKYWQEIVSQGDFESDIEEFVANLCEREIYDWLAIFLEHCLQHASNTMPQVTALLRGDNLAKDLPAVTQALISDNIILSRAGNFQDFLAYLNTNNYLELRKKLLEDS